jgi:hypothetical protein
VDQRDNQQLIKAIAKCQIGALQTCARLLDRIRENPTKYLEELMG